MYLNFLIMYAVVQSASLLIAILNVSDIGYKKNVYFHLKIGDEKNTYIYCNEPAVFDVGQL